MHSLTKKVGQGSSWHDFVGEDLTIFNTSSSLIGVNDEKAGMLALVSCVEFEGGKAALILVILSEKKHEKESARDLLLLLSGSVDSGFL